MQSGPRNSSIRDQLLDLSDRMRESERTTTTTQEFRISLGAQLQKDTEEVCAPFESKIAAHEMRQLALVAHNHMKPAMKEFITTYSEILKKFRITGTQTTMRMCKTLWGEDNPDVEYGLTCTSGPLGGDAQIAALMCLEDLGGLIFFVDPLSAHPHQADIESLQRLSNCGNIIVCSNPSSAMSMMHTFRMALEHGRMGMIPSFFKTLESPAVPEYKRQQDLALKSVVNSTPSNQEKVEEKKEDLLEESNRSRGSLLLAGFPAPRASLFSDHNLRSSIMVPLVEGSSGDDDDWDAKAEESKEDEATAIILREQLEVKDRLIKKLQENMKATNLAAANDNKAEKRKGLKKGLSFFKSKSKKAGAVHWA